MRKMCREELIEWLYQLIDCEFEKPEEETDQDLLMECSDYLEELQAGEDNLSPEEIRFRLERIKAQVVRESHS